MEFSCRKCGLDFACREYDAGEREELRRSYHSENSGAKKIIDAMKRKDFVLAGEKEYDGRPKKAMLWCPACGHKCWGNHDWQSRVPAVMMLHDNERFLVDKKIRMKCDHCRVHLVLCLTNKSKAYWKKHLHDMHRSFVCPFCSWNVQHDDVTEKG